MIKDISNDEYHNGPGISKSHLDVISKSPLQYWEKYINPERERREPTEQMMMGTAVHTAILEPEKFGDEIVVPPKIDKRTKSGKAEWAEFMRNNQGKTFIDASQNAQVNGMVSAFMNNSRARNLLTNGDPEKSVFWEDEETGLLCKCRPDYINYEKNILVDLKTSADSTPKAFAKSAVNFRYHVQSAWYKHGFQMATGKNFYFILIVVQSVKPHEVRMYLADSKIIDRGADLFRRDLNLLAKCLKEDNWKAPEAIEELTLPAWAYYD